MNKILTTEKNLYFVYKIKDNTFDDMETLQEEILSFVIFSENDLEARKTCVKLSGNVNYINPEFATVKTINMLDSDIIYNNYNRV